MLEPEEVSAMLRLKELGWGAKRIARELGVSRNTVKDYIAAGGWTPYQQPERKKALDGLEELAEGTVASASWQCRRDPPGAGGRDWHRRQPSHRGASGEALPAGAGSGSASDSALRDGAGRPAIAD